MLELNTKDNKELMWQTHKGELISVSDMETSHMINIIRRFINQICEHTEIKPLEIKSPVAKVNFSKRYLLREYLLYFSKTVDERIKNGEQLKSGYSKVWHDCKSKMLELANINLINI